MSSWRNLMTPPQEKYYINEGSPELEDSFNQEKYPREVSDFTDEVSSRQPVIQSQKFKDLHSQLSQLKDDLGRSSIRAKHTKQPSCVNFSTISASPFEKYGGEATPKPSIQAKRKFLTRDTQDKELPSASTCSGFSRKFLSKEVEVRDFDQSGSFEQKTPEYLRNDEPYSAKTNKSIMKTKSSILTSQRQNKKTVRKVEFISEESEGSQSTNKLQETLAEYCQQISQLKQIAMDSQKQINSLCQEVAKQRTESEAVKKHLGLRFDESPVNQIAIAQPNYSSAKTYLRKNSNVFVSSFSSQEENWEAFWPREKSNSSKSPSPVNNTLLMSKRSDKVNNEMKFSTFKPNEDRFNLESSSSRQICKEASTQCDAMLDAIIDYDEEENEQKERELKSLKTEVETHKEQQKDMVSIFQQMLGQLEAAEKRNAQDLQRKVNETQKTFSDFYNAFNSKLESINPSSNSRSHYRSRSKFE